jgi:PAS domain S-box-containing protein
VVHYGLSIPAMKDLFRFRLLLISGILLLILSFYLWQEKSADTSVMRNTYNLLESHELLESSEKAYNSLLEMESGMRGFILTGDSVFLSQYLTGKERISFDLKKLQDLAEKHINLRYSIDTLENLMYKKMEFMENGLFLYEKAGKKEAIALINTLKGAEIQNQNRMILRRLERAQSDFLKEHNIELQDALQAQNRSFYTLLAILTGLISALFYILGKNHRQALTIRKDLETQVQKQTEQLQKQYEHLEKESNAKLEYQSKLLHSEARFRSIIESSPIPVLLTDEAGNINFLNQAFELMFGYSLNQLSTIDDWFNAAYPDPENRELMIEIWRNSLIDKTLQQSIPIETEIHCKNDSFKTVLIICAPLSKDKFGQQAVYFLDISERKLSENKVMEGYIRLRGIIDNLFSFLAILDINGRLIDINKTIMETYSEQQENWLGTDFLDIPYLTYSDETYYQLAECLRKAKAGTINQIEHKVLMKNGLYQDHEIMFIPVKDQLNNIINIIVYGNDVTEINARALELRRSLQFLEKIGEMASIGGWELDLKTNLVTWSAETCRIHDEEPGFKPTLEQAINFYTEDSKPLIQQAVFEMSKGIERDLELSIITRKGRLVHVRAIGQAEYEHGIPVRIIGAFQDITSQKQAKDELILSRKNYESLINSIDSIVWQADPKTFMFSFVSNQAENILGYPLEEWYKPDFWVNTIHLDDVQRTVAFCKESTASGTDHEFEYRMVAADGSIVWLRDIVTVIKENDTVTALRGIMIDITAMKLAQAENAALLQRVHLATSAAEMGIWEFDVQTGRLIWDNQMYTLNEQAPETYITMEYWQNTVLEPLSGKNFHQALEQAVKNNNEVDLVLTVNMRDSSQKLIQCHALLTADQYSAAQTFTGICYDITERIMSHKALQEAEAATQLLLDSTPNGILIVDTKGCIQRTNERLRAMTGFMDSELIGNTIEILVPETLRHSHIALRDTFDFRNRAMGPDRNLFARRKDNTQFPAIINLTPLTLMGQKVILVSLVDITEEKNMEKQLLRIQRMESIGTLAGGIAHDINNILTPIMLGLSVLARKPVDDQSKKLIDLMQTNTRRGSDLIKQVMAFARGVESQRVPIQISHLVEEMRIIISETFPRFINLHIETEKDLPVILGDITQLHQVLLNLCVNARDAMQNGGKLEIKLESILIDEQFARMNVEARQGYFVVLTVTDQGTGIPPAVVERIFDPFFTTKETGKGTGLGLSTVMAIVKGHKGFLNVYTELGKGSTFKVYLPASEAELKRDSTEKVAELRNNNNALILVVDDEDNIREITCATLESNGYQVITASDGTEAIAHYAKRKDEISAVITDMMMPHMDGNATIRALQKLNPDIKILAVSGLMQQGAGQIEGNISFLRKPYTAETLLKTLDEVLRPL